MVKEGKDQLQYDIVIVGSGFAGLAAALQAMETGASVVLLGSKNPFACNSALSSGGIILADTVLQRNNKINDSAALLTQDILRANGNSISVEVVEAAAHEATHLYDWLTSMGIQLPILRPLANHTLPRVHRGPFGGAHILRLLFQEVQRRGAHMLIGTLARHLIMSAGKVQGVEAIGHQGTTEIRALRGVILAAGGFAQNRRMVEHFLPNFSGFFCAGGSGSTGDGIQMGLEIGARTTNMDSAVLTPLGSIKRAGALPGIFEAILQGAIFVNKKGQRFVIEKKGFFSETAFPITLQADGIALLVLNEAMKKKIVKLERYMDTFIRKGLFFFGKDADELAWKTGLDKSNFNATVMDCGFSGTLYGTWIKPALVMSHGGLVVNAAAQVIHANGHPISQLFAAGDNTAGLGGGVKKDRPFAGYIGTGCLWALASGRIAGRNAAS